MSIHNAHIKKKEQSQAWWQSATTDINNYLTVKRSQISDVSLTIHYAIAIEQQT